MAAGGESLRESQQLVERVLMTPAVSGFVIRSISLMVQLMFMQRDSINWLQIRITE